MPGLCTKTKYIQFSRSRYEGTSRNQSPSISKDEEYELLETTNMLVICFSLRSRIWPDQNPSSGKAAQQDLSLKDEDNDKQKSTISISW